MLEQDYPNFELILVDDRSEDRTAESAKAILAGRENCKVITITDLPSGWTGKCHALHAAVPQSGGEWLAFLDADSMLHPSALSRCHREALARNIGMVTLTPEPVLRTFWEKVLQPVFMGLSGIIYPLAEVNDPTSPIASANGMFYLIRRSAYQAIGAHASVKAWPSKTSASEKESKPRGWVCSSPTGERSSVPRMYNELHGDSQGMDPYTFSLHELPARGCGRSSAFPSSYKLTGLYVGPQSVHADGQGAVSLHMAHSAANVGSRGCFCNDHVLPDFGNTRRVFGPCIPREHRIGRSAGGDHQEDNFQRGCPVARDHISPESLPAHLIGTVHEPTVGHPQLCTD